MKIKVTLLVSLQGLLLLTAMVYGVLVHKYKLPPYPLLIFGYNTLQSQQVIPWKISETPKKYTKNDVEALISITQSSDVSKQRKVLLQFLWGQPKLPSSMPAAIVKDFKDSYYDDIPSIHRIDKLLIMMEFGIESIVYKFIPKNPNNQVILYHQGHEGGFYNGTKQIRQFIENGYTVIAFSMPLKGLNNQPTVKLSLGQIKMTRHDAMRFLLPKQGHSIKYFIEPVIITLNYLERNYDYSLVSMVGISGGGWTTTLAAAADTRISKSFPVAGTYPIYLRSDTTSSTWGDFEQNDTDLYTSVNYLDLYILGAHGKNRKQLQILNKYDPCCFSGTKGESYKDIVKARLQQLGTGEFDLLLDDSHHKHMISNLAMSQILEEIKY